MGPSSSYYVYLLESSRRRVKGGPRRWTVQCAYPSKEAAQEHIKTWRKNDPTPGRYRLARTPLLVVVRSRS